MLLKFDEPKLLSDVVGIISELVQEVRAKVTKSGLNITAIDPANVALVMLKIPASAFSQFKLEDEQNEELGLNLNDLKAVLRRAGIASNLVMEREENLLKLQIQDKVKRSFSLALISIEGEEKIAPALEFSSKIELSSIDLAEAIEDASIVADSCSLVLSSKPEAFVIEAKGSLNSSKTELSSDECKMQGEGKAKYSLEYLQKFMRAAKIADKATLQFGTDYPCKLDFKTQKLELSFILAPRVENEE